MRGSRHPLASFDVDHVRALIEEVRALPQGASLEEDGQAVAELLRGSLVDDDGAPACPLVRVYITRAYAKLSPSDREFAAEVLGREPHDAVRCLTLLGTAGELPAWNDRLRSQGHRAIPLPSEDFVQRLPMVTGLIEHLGLDLATVVDPPAGKTIVRLAQRTNDVFHVEEARGSPLLPAQEEFVVPYGIASAVGFGGMLATGDLFAVLLFSRVRVSGPVARTLKILAQPLRVRFLALSLPVRRPR
jgi:hypothetical protein